MELTMSKIMPGCFYANDYDNGIDRELNIVLSLGRSERFPQLFKTEVIWIVDGKPKAIYKNENTQGFFERKATDEEIKLFKCVRSQYDGLPRYTESVLGVKISDLNLKSLLGAIKQIDSQKIAKV
jgi:hypothetical protein